jgi:hypothetical protein
MRSCWILLLGMLPACSRDDSSGQGVPRPAPVPSGIAAAHPIPGVDPCTVSCAAAAHEDCTALCQQCDFDPARVLDAGGYPLACRGAMAAACGSGLGFRTCTNDCEAASLPPDAGSVGQVPLRPMHAQP